MAEPIKKRDLQEWLMFCEQVQNTTNIPFQEDEKAQKLRKAKALANYNYFVKTYFPLYADSDCGYFHIAAANKLAADKNCFAVLEWPREHAKSVHANILIPMWLMAKGELTGMILMGKNGDDAANLLADLQAQLQYNQLYAHDFGHSYNMGSWETGDFTTKTGIRFLAIGRDQSPRGARKNEKRPNYAVIDDIDDDILVNNQRRVTEIVERILGALYFALSIKGARVVVAGNRIHPQSVLAHLVGDTKAGQPKREGIYHSKVYATESKPGKRAYIGEAGAAPAWKERYTLEELKAKMATAGLLMSRKEFYHEHTVEGKIFKSKYMQWKPMPARNWKDYKVIIGYFDPSFENKVTSDFKAVALWSLKVFKDSVKYEKHLLSRFTERAELGDVYAWMAKQEELLPAGTSIIWYMEQQFFNRPVKEALERFNRSRAGKPQLYITVDTRNKGDKFSRIVKMEMEYADRNVYFNIDEFHNTHMIEGNNQLKSIEPGYKTPDDAPDADEGAWYYIDQHLPSVGFAPIIGERKDRSHF
jgi:hypothetical protein